MARNNFCIYKYSYDWEQAAELFVRYNATGERDVASIPGEVIGLFQLIQFFQPYYGLGIGSASNRNEHQEFSWS
jgi:hypothetical protein